MSYEVTATRRRPQKFDDLVGQEFVAETLKNSIKSEKIAHAYLFTGPRGCGKTSTARILAKALNCQNGPTDNPCGTCSNCQEITKGSSLDIIEIDGASNNSVENIRQIKDEVLFPPTKCRYKVYIIDEVHMLTTNAFNALLKTIEEPPPYVIFIFATTELQKVPATIKSRCQQFNFRLVSIDKVKQCLADAAAEMGIQAEDEALFWIARESTGSMRDAYTLFDQVVAFSDGHITYEKIRDKLGLVGVDRLNSIFEACAAKKTDVVINMLDEFLQGGVSIEQFISNCADYLRSLLLIKNGVTKEALLGNSPERYSAAVLNTWNSVQIERALSIYLQLYRDIRYSLSPRYELELAFSRVCWLSDYVSNMEVKKAVDAAQRLLQGAPAAANSVQPVSNAAAAVSVQNSAPVQPAAEENPFVPASEPAVNAESQTQDDITDFSKLPPDMPRFSIFSDSAPAQQQGDSSRPFSNGGPLPPKTSVVVDTSDFDGDWTNTDEIPEDDYAPEAYSEDEIEKSRIQDVQNTYEQSELSAAQSVVEPAQVNEELKTAEGRTISIAQLRGTVIASLAVNNSFITSVLSKTGNWKVSESGVETTVGSEYELELLKKNVSLIAGEISMVLGKTMTFSANIVTLNKEAEKPVEIPPQVDMLVRMFKGTVVGR